VNAKPAPRPESKKETRPAAPLTPEGEETAAAGRAQEMARMFLRYAAGHQGALPPDLSALISCGLMDSDRAGEYLGSVIEYRGAELTTQYYAKFTVMRFRIGKRADKELRTLLDGTVFFCTPSDPIAEDATDALPGRNSAIK
jgi:hypothetical protein